MLALGWKRLNLGALQLPGVLGKIPLFFAFVSLSA